MPDTVPHFFIRNMISVADAQKSQKHVIYVVCIFFSKPAATFHVSHAYRKTEMTKERISLILELREMFLSFYSRVLSFDNAPIVWAILDRMSCFDP